MKKTLIATALISVLGMGAAFADHGGFGGFGGKGGPRGDMMGEQLKDKLNLTDEQKTQFEAIMKEQRTKMDDLHQQMQAQMKTMRTETDTKIAAILNTEQAATFKQMQDDRQKRQDERREELKKRLDQGDF